MAGFGVGPSAPCCGTCSGGDTTVCVSFYTECIPDTLDVPGECSVTGPGGFAASGSASTASPFCFTMADKGTYTLTFTPTATCFNPEILSFTQDCSHAGETETVATLVRWRVDSGVTNCCHSECDCPPPKTLTLSGSAGSVTMTDSAIAPGYTGPIGSSGWYGDTFETFPEGAEMVKCTSGFNSGSCVPQIVSNVTVPVSYAIRCDGLIWKAFPVVWVNDNPCNTFGFSTGRWVPGLATDLPYCTSRNKCLSVAHASGTATGQSWCPVSFGATLTADGVDTPASHCTSDHTPPDMGETVAVSE